MPFFLQGLPKFPMLHFQFGCLLLVLLFSCTFFTGVIAGGGEPHINIFRSIIVLGRRADIEATVGHHYLSPEIRKRFAEFTSKNKEKNLATPLILCKFFGRYVNVTYAQYIFPYSLFSLCRESVSPYFSLPFSRLLRRPCNDFGTR